MEFNKTQKIVSDFDKLLIEAHKLNNKMQKNHEKIKDGI